MPDKLKLVSLCLLMFLISACSSETGNLSIHANGEDFVRQGFVSKDGWSISFDQVGVNVGDVTAYQSDPPFDASSGDNPSGSSVTLSGVGWVDLAEGNEEADPIELDELEAPAGHYNAVGWDMITGEDGYTIQLVGTAEKDGESIQFDIRVSDEYSYVCGEYVGDERKGFVDPDSFGDVELTFHFDHLFGDAELEADETLNVFALGFDPLAELAEGGHLDVTSSELAAGLGAEDYATWEEALATLGHVGEGHCFEQTHGYTAK